MTKLKENVNDFMKWRLLNYFQIGILLSILGNVLKESLEMIFSDNPRETEYDFGIPE